MKKFIIFIILSLINVCMYGTDTKEVIVRKSGLIYRKTDDKLIKLDDTTITVKLKRGKAIDKNLMVVRSNCLGYYDISVPKDVDIEDFVDKLRETGNYEIVKYNVIAESGEKMVSQNPSVKTLTFSTAGWKLGLYAIKVTLGKNSWSKKFINNR